MRTTTRAVVILAAAVLLAGVPPAAAAAGAPTAGAPAHDAAATAAAPEPITLEAVEIRGAYLVPQAVFIVAGAGEDGEAAASVLDYLLELEPLDSGVGLALLVLPPWTMATHSEP